MPNDVAERESGVARTVVVANHFELHGRPWSNNFRGTNIFHFTIDGNDDLTSFRNTSERVCD